MSSETARLAILPVMTVVCSNFQAFSGALFDTLILCSGKEMRCGSDYSYRRAIAAIWDKGYGKDRKKIKTG